MSKSVIEIDNRLTGIGIAAERAKVIIGDLQQDYLGQGIHGIEDAWRLVLPYYDNARIKADIVNQFVCEIIDQLEELSKYLEGAAV